MLEAFGRHHMPNAYERYQEARVKALELGQSVKETFPKGKTSDPTGGRLFAQANKDLAVAVAQAFRLRDELCFFLLFHQAGIFPGDMLAENDALARPFSIRLAEEAADWPDDTPRADTALAAAAAGFAAKHLPETLSGYRRLCGLFDEGARQYGELRRTALALDAPRARNELAFLKTRLEGLAAFLQWQKSEIAARQLAYALEETTIGDLEELDLSNAVHFQTFELGLELKGYAHCALSKLKLRWPNGVEVEMVGCPPGTFMMGRPREKGDLGETQHQEVLATGFWMCKHECTWALWDAVMGRNLSALMGEERPVDSVSWNECQEFLKRLNAQPSVQGSGLVFRLPTEEEWEYACRAGSKGKYCKIAGGREITKDTLGEVARYWNSPSYEGFVTTYAVGGKKPNAWGLYDMHGNVREWTSTATVAGNERVYRGGSASSTANGCALGHDRGSERPGGPGFFRGGVSFIGFRFVAIDADAQAETERRVAEARERAEQKAAEGIPEAVAALLENMVEIPGKKYRVCKYEVTQALWEAVMAVNPSKFKGADHPVECVSWNDCQKFIDKLNGLPEVKASGWVFRLPTLGEWEHACLAGGSGKYGKATGGRDIREETLGEVAWYDGNSGEQTHPVGKKAPNAWGLYDMLGNVREWTSGVSLVGAAFGSARMSCGGSWNDNDWNCRLGDQDLYDSDAISAATGFRLVAERKR